MNAHIEQTKTQSVLAWMAITVLAGIGAGVSSMTTWTMLAAVALTPPLLVARFWGEPANTTTARIREAIR